MAKFFYKAVHSTGTVHLRTSANRSGYKFCVAGKSLTDASFCSRRDLAQKELDKRAKRNGGNSEILLVVEITSSEHAALTRANTVTSAVVFRGKKFTTSRSIQQPPFVAVSGIYQAASEQRIPLKENDSAETHARFPDGFWISHRSEIFRIQAYHHLDRAQQDAAERIAQGYTTEIFILANG